MLTTKKERTIYMKSKSIHNTQNIEELTRKMSKNGKKLDSSLKGQLQEIPITIKNVAAWCKCYFLIKRLNKESPNRIEVFRSVFKKKIKKIDATDPNNKGLIKEIKERCNDKDVIALLFQ